MLANGRGWRSSTRQAFVFIACRFRSLESDFADCEKKSLRCISTRGLRWHSDGGFAPVPISSPVDKLQKGRKWATTGWFYLPHYNILAQNLRTGWKDSWCTQWKQTAGSPLSFGWQGALSKDLHAAPGAQEDQVQYTKWSFPNSYSCTIAFDGAEVTPLPRQSFTLNFICANFSISSEIEIWYFFG